MLKAKFLILFSCALLIREDVLAQTIDDLLRSSNVVSAVTIVSGQVLDVPFEECGIVYKGKMSDLIKGNGDNGYISFRVDRPLLVGWTYLVFVTDNQVVQVSSPNSFERPGSYKLESCSDSGVKNTITHFGEDNEYAAIFQLRSLSELGKESAGPYFVGPVAFLSLLDTKIEKHVLTIHHPFLPVVEVALQRDQFTKLLRAYTNTL